MSSQRHPVVADLVNRLQLQAHPEGGFYREVHRSSLRVQSSLHAGDRSALTHIHFLLEAGTFSAWHVVTSDEIWHHAEGAPLELHLLELEPGSQEIYRLRVVVLGRDLAKGQLPHAVVPAGVWQAARSLGDFSLMGCTVAPGFEFGDFSMPARDELLQLFPDHVEAILAFTRE